MEFVRLGKIIKTFGLNGEVRCYSLTDFPSLRFKKGTVLSLLNETTGERKEVHVVSFRDSGDNYFLKFKEIGSIEEAEAIKGSLIEMDKETAKMPEGYVRLQDLIDCQVYDESDTKLGTVIGIQQYSPAKNLIVKKENGEKFYVPFVPAFIVNYSLDEKKIIVKIIQGML